MSTDMSLREENPAQSLIEWADAGAAAKNLALSMVASPFVPERFKDPQQAAAAAIAGASLGFSPFTSWQNLYVVHNQAAMYARTMVALVQSHGHEVWTESATDTKVVVCGQRKGSEHVERSEWDITRATKAGYTNNAKYRTNPREMLYAKAAAEVCRHIGADVLLGIPYTVEDLELTEEEPTVTVVRETPKRRVHRKSKNTAPTPVEPALDDTAPIVDLVEETETPEPTPETLDDTIEETA